MGLPLSKCCKAYLLAANVTGSMMRCAACGEAYDMLEKTIPVADKWTKLRNWLTNLSNQTTTKKAAKIGIKIALQMMDRLDEAESK